MAEEIIEPVENIESPPDSVEPIPEYPSDPPMDTPENTESPVGDSQDITRVYISVNGEWTEGIPSEGDTYKEEVTHPDGRVSFVIKVKPVTEVNTRITRLAFKLRMTMDERKVIRNAAEINDDVYDFMDLLSEATFIDLTDPSTVGSINALTYLGLLETSRATAILTDPIMEHEKYVAP